jgi:hypothetical protein
MTSITTAESAPDLAVPDRAARWEPWSGIAFPVLFLTSIAVSSPPADNASDVTWVANYTGHAEQARHLATGVLLVLAGLSLAAFLTAVSRRVELTAPSRTFSPLPRVAAATAAAGIAVGGVVMAAVSGGELIGSYPLPGADVLRLSNDLGFALVSVAGMLSAALAIAVLSVQGRAAGLFGRRSAIFGLVVAVLLVGALAFVPILGALLWSLITAVRLIRHPLPAD